MKAEKVGETRTDVKSASLVETLAATLAKVEAKTVSKTLGDVEAEALLDMFPDMVSYVLTKTIADKLTCV